MAEQHSKSSPKTGILLKAACCVIAADGRVGSRELSILSKTLQSLGVDHTKESLQVDVVATCKQLLKGGLEANVEAVARVMSSCGGNVLAAIRSMCAELAAANSGNSKALQIAESLNEAAANVLRNHDRKQAAHEEQAEMVDDAYHDEDYDDDEDEDYDDEPEWRALLLKLLPVAVFLGALWWWWPDSFELLGPGAVRVPEISVQGMSSAVRFGDWRRPNPLTLEGTMTYTPTPANPLGLSRIEYEQFDSGGIKLKTGTLSHPSLKPNETGQVSMFLDAETTKVILNVCP